MKAPSKTESAEATYIRTTPGSRALYHEACRVMPGGTTRTTVYFAPYPLYIERGQGARVWDVDGTSRLDFIGNYSALILGHAHPKVTAAVAEQLARGTSVAAANPVEVQLAQERSLFGHGAIHELGDRGDHVRHAPRPDLHGQAEDRALRGRVSRDARLRRDLDQAGSRACRTANCPSPGARLGRHATGCPGRHYRASLQRPGQCGAHRPPAPARTGRRNRRARDRRWRRHPG